MKKIWKLSLLIFIFNAMNNSVEAQNLVPNPSFEDMVACPDHGGNIDQAAGWINCGLTPDYYNACANTSFPSLGVPDGFYSGYQYAFDGNAYAGFVTYQCPIIQHEFIGVQLTQPLDSGIKYYVSCYISRSDDIICTANNFGFRFFTNISFSGTNPAPVDNFSHIHFTSIITDSINWTQMAGSFIADSSYQFLVIGNFYDNINTSVFNCDTNAVDGTYYLVDAVCVSEDSLTCYNWTGLNEVNGEDKVSIYPNPACEFVRLSNLRDKVVYSITNSLGITVLSGIATKESNEINISSLSDGLYIIKINKKYFYKFLIIY